MRRVLVASLVPLLAMSAIAPRAALASKPTDDGAKTAAADRAMRWLVDALPGVVNSSGTPRKPFTFAIAGLDLLVAERTSDGKEADRLRRCKDVVLAFIDEAGRRSRDAAELPDAHGVADSRKFVQYTWVLGAACLFLAEAKARGVFRAEADRGLAEAVALLEEAEDPNGAFGHGRIASTSPPPTTTPPTAPPTAPTPAPAGRKHPKPPAPPLLPLPALPALPRLGGGYPSTLVSTTNVVALGLGLARAFCPATALPAADRMLERLRAHYPKAQVTGGSFPYDLSQRSGGGDATSVGRTAGAALAMRAIGVPATSDVLRRADAFVDGRLGEIAEGHGSPALNVFLGAFGAFARSTAAHDAFDAVFVPRIIAHARPDGSLDCVCDGKAFAVTCDSPDHGMLAGQPDAFAAGQRAYVTALLVFPLLLDRGGKLRVLQPPAGSAPVAPPRPTTPADPKAGTK